jgi:cytochrome P450
MDVELFGPAFQADPHLIFAQLRDAAPVHQVTLPSGVPAWLVTRYDEARRALSDPRLSKGGLVPPIGENSLLAPAMRDSISRHMLAADPPDHTRLRRLVSAVFTARRTEALRPRVQQITDDLLAQLAGQDRVDLLGTFAFPLPMRVICELLGVPLVDRDAFRAWSDVIVAGAAAGDRLSGAVTSMLDYIRELLDRKRAAPSDDLLSALIAVRDGGDRLSENELTSMVFLLLVAGHETTVNLIGNAMYVLLTRPDRLAELRADRHLLPAAIEEFLRYESPVQTATFRLTTEPVELGGCRIPAQQPVMISLLSANRDPARFAEADLVDLDRGDAGHLAFGHGIHYCLGAPLARLEAQIGIGSLLARFPEIRLDAGAEPLAWRPGALMHGLLYLPVRLGARAGG